MVIAHETNTDEDLHVRQHRQHSVQCAPPTGHGSPTDSQKKSRPKRGGYIRGEALIYAYTYIYGG